MGGATFAEAAADGSLLVSSFGGVGGPSNDFENCVNFGSGASFEPLTNALCGVAECDDLTAVLDEGFAPRTTSHQKHPVTVEDAVVRRPVE